MTRTLDPTDDPARAIEDLAGSTRPWLFGVRHHSPACSAALPPLLDKLAPTVLAIELPADLAHWIEWISHPEAEAPLAIAAVSARGDELGFYPYADFSPELVAMRWARERGIPIHAIDLPAARRTAPREPRLPLGIAERLHGDDSWEHLVEGPAVRSQPERVRRAALLYGWALRIDAARGDGVDDRDLAREAHMREAIAELTSKPGARVAAIVGSFHASALLPEPQLWEATTTSAHEHQELVSSLIPYGFELLDARSGYPAGIRDPAWHQRLWHTLTTEADVTELVARCLVEITRAIRARGLPASAADAHAATELATSLAALRGLAAPGRRELVEAVQSALTQGELLGRGRAVARAMESVLVGGQRGHLAEGTPRSGLGPHVAELLAELRLPHAQTVDPDEVRLDPLRSRIDRRRHVAMCRLRACGVPYARELDSMAAGGVEALTVTWRVHFTPATEAMIELAGMRGVTLRQAAAGALRSERARLTAEDHDKPGALVVLAAAAAEAGCGDLTADWLSELAGPRLPEATLAELIALVALVDRVLAGHVVGLPSADDAVPGEVDAFSPPAIDRAAIVGAAVASVIGLAGSEALDDARALAELVRLLDRPEYAGLGDSRLRWSVDELERTGAPLISGAAAVAQVLVGTRTPEQLGASISGWLDAAVDPDGRSRLAARLRGAVAIAGPLFESAPVFLEQLIARVEALSDQDYLVRAPALREGFAVLSNASRARLLHALGGLQERDVITDIAPEIMTLAADADQAGKQAMSKVDPP